MDEQSIREEVTLVISRLGFVYSHLGTSCLLDAVMLCVHDPEALTAVTKRVYPAVAKKAGTKWRSVERNMRTALDAVWKKGNREFLNELAGYELRVRPTAGELINYITVYIWDLERKMR